MVTVWYNCGNGVVTVQFREYFEYTMEAPRSLKQKEGEPTMSYINKGNFLYKLAIFQYTRGHFLKKLKILA